MVDEILAHQLVDDPVVRVILELVLEPPYDLLSSALHGRRSTDLLNIMAPG
jgi:hypothetical protein